MKRIKHTPGPFKTTSFPAVYGTVYTVNKGKTELARLDSTPNAKNNANLFAAAPELLKALRKIASDARDTGDEWVEKTALDAIAKVDK